jgi:hypothetical protein
MLNDLAVPITNYTSLFSHSLSILRLRTKALLVYTLVKSLVVSIALIYQLGSYRCGFKHPAIWAITFLVAQASNFKLFKLHLIVLRNGTKVDFIAEKLQQRNF